MVSCIDDVGIATFVLTVEHNVTGGGQIIFDADICSLLGPAAPLRVAPAVHYKEYNHLSKRPKTHRASPRPFLATNRSGKA